jgi:hypothetical protein
MWYSQQHHNKPHQFTPIHSNNAEKPTKFPLLNIQPPATNPENYPLPNTPSPIPTPHTIPLPHPQSLPSQCKNLAQTTPERSVPQYSSTPKFNDPTNSAGWAEEGVGRCWTMKFTQSGGTTVNDPSQVRGRGGMGGWENGGEGEFWGGLLFDSMKR